MKKTFKDYEPGFVHIDIKYLPQMPDETARRYLFVAIDRATRWVFIDIYTDQTESSSVDFLSKVHKACPVKTGGNQRQQFVRFRQVSAQQPVSQFANGQVQYCKIQRIT